MKGSALFFERIGELLRAHPKVAVATVVRTQGSTPRERGAKMAVLPGGAVEGTVGGGILEKRVVEDALRMMREGPACELVRYDLVEEERGGIGAICGGGCEVLIEVAGGGARVLVCGGGHVGTALGRAAMEAGWSVTVVDDRREFLRADRLPGARLLELRPDDPALLAEVDADTAAVIVTRGHALDTDALRLFVRSGAFYVGMIGSKRKVAGVFAALEKEGVEPGRLARVFAPIGLDIGAETPEEIAVSILAELIAVRRRGGAPPGSMRGGAR